MIGLPDRATSSLDKLSACGNGNWISLIDPNSAKIAYLQRKLGIPALFIKHALDVDELARIESEGRTTLIVLRIPAFQRTASAIPFTTTPLGIILTEHPIITICKWRNDILPDLM